MENLFSEGKKREKNLQVLCKSRKYVPRIYRYSEIQAIGTFDTFVRQACNVDLIRDNEGFWVAAAILFSREDGAELVVRNEQLIELARS